MIRLAILLLLCAGSVQGQLQVQAGASSLFGTDGVSVLYATPSYATEFGLGLANGHAVPGFGIHFQRHGCDWFVGDHAVAFIAGSSGISSTFRGVELDCKTKTHSMTFFTGATGGVYSTPYFTGANPDHFGSGTMLMQKFGGLTVTGVAAIDGNKHTVLEGLAYRWKGIHLDETAGNVEGRSYFDGEGSFTSRHLSVSVAHADFLGIASTNSESVTAGTAHVSVFASAFESKVTGQAAGVNLNVSFLSANVLALRSNSRLQVNTFLIEHISHHFSVSQLIADRSVSLGGSYTGNLVSAGVGYQEMFSPTAGFERALTVTLRIQLSRGTFNGNVNVLPNGVFYTGYGGLYVTGPALAQSQDHTAE